MIYVFKCSNCGSNIEKNSSFCGNCGGMVVKNPIGGKYETNVIGIGKVEYVQYIKVLPVNSEELRIINCFKRSLNNDSINIEKRTEDYISLMYKDFCLARVYVNSKSKYVKLLLCNEDKKKYENDNLFKRQSNKKQVMWATDYDDNNYDKYIELINNKIFEIDKQVIE